MKRLNFRAIFWLIYCFLPIIAPVSLAPDHQCTLYMTDAPLTVKRFSTKNAKPGRLWHAPCMEINMTNQTPTLLDFHLRQGFGVDAQLLGAIDLRQTHRQRDINQG